MSTETAFSRWLREEMPKRGYPVGVPRAGGISRLAKDAGISLANMSRMVSGNQEPSLDTLRKLGTVFGYEIGQMMAFAGLAEYTRVGTTATKVREAPATPEPSRLFEAIDGGRNLENYTEAQFDTDLEAGRTPPGPPGGFRNEAEQKMWAITVLTPAERYAAIRGLRQAKADAARLGAQQLAVERDQRKAR